MSRNPSKLVLAMAVLLAVWVSVFWLYKPRANGAGGAGLGGITFDQPPDLAKVKALASTDQTVPVAPAPLPLPVAPLPGQVEPPAPPVPAPVPGKRLIAPEFTDYTVQKGDTFAAISKRHYGTASHADAISRANPFVTPDKLYAGRTKLRIPKDPTNIQGRIEAAPGSSEPESETHGAGTHTVQPGETLGAISKRYYGTTARWKDILAANTDQFDKPEKMRTGMTITIPPKD